MPRMKSVLAPPVRWLALHDGLTSDEIVNIRSSGSNGRYCPFGACSALYPFCDTDFSASAIDFPYGQASIVSVKDATDVRLMAPSIWVFFILLWYSKQQGEVIFWNSVAFHKAVIAAKFSYCNKPCASWHQGVSTWCSMHRFAFRNCSCARLI